MVRFLSKENKEIQLWDEAQIIQIFFKRDEKKIRLNIISQFVCQVSGQAIDIELKYKDGWTTAQNRSLGAQIKNQIKGYDYGTIFGEFIISD